jgi:hypothetical protein
MAAWPVVAANSKEVTTVLGKKFAMTDYRALAGKNLLSAIFTAIYASYTLQNTHVLVAG